MHEIYQDEPSMMKRLARSWAYALVNEPIHMEDDDFLVGQIYFAPTINRQEEPRWAEFDYGPRYDERIEKDLPEIFPILGYERPGAEIAPKSWISPYYGGSTGHIGWHWDWIVKDGVKGMFKRLDAAMPNVDVKGREVLEAMRISLQGLLDMNAAHLRALEVRLASAGGAAKAMLAEKLEICRQVPLRGARNFREAVQSCHIWPPYRFPIGEFLRSGENRIRVRVGNLIINAVTQYENYNWKWYKAPTHEALDAGLFGPVAVCRPAGLEKGRPRIGSTKSCDEV